MTTQHHVTPEGAGAAPVAIIGLAGRFPGADSVADLWRLQVAGGEAVTEAPADRPWFHDLYDSRLSAPGKVASTRAGFLTGLDLFDAGFFEMSPREADRADPQLRLLLEAAYETLEDAGLPADRVAGTATGVFVGACERDYWLRQVDDLEDLDFYSESGSATGGPLSGRLSYTFDLRGPSMTLDTACSSSLTAIHLACRALQSGDCELALAGGVNVILTPHNQVVFNRAGVHSPDGRCKFGDAAADGFVRGEAVGLALLKPLERAAADGDRIRAVIAGGAVLHQGFTGSGMPTPSAAAQIRMLRAAHAAAGTDARRVAFVEAHGTGTRLGDRAELTALCEVFGPRPEGDEPCLVTTAKTAVGHCESASGIVGLATAVMCLERRTVPGNPRLTRLNPAIDWDRAPLALPREPVRLPGDGPPLVAGVNSFGATGTNAHLVLESWQPSEAPAPPPPGRAEVLALSARTADALRELAHAYAESLDTGAGDGPPPALAAVCAGATGRRSFEHRLAVVAAGSGDMARSLRDVAAGRPTGPAARLSPAKPAGNSPRVVFVFPGQGSQWAGMGRELLTGCEPFRAALEACDKILAERLDWSLITAVQEGDDGWTGVTRLVQPALWAMGVALARTWEAWGVTPDAVIGQSQGEIAAAHIAGAIGLADAGALICERAALTTRLSPPGAMARVDLPEDEARELAARAGGGATVAVVNSPGSTVLAGTPGAIDAVERECARRGVDCLRIKVDYAAHSPAVDPVRGPLLRELRDLAPGPTAVPFVSAITGRESEGSTLDAGYWWRNLREPVRLGDAIRSRLGAGQGAGPVTFLQMAPHPVLTTVIEENAHAAGAPDTLILPSLRREAPERATMLGSLAALYAAGHEVDRAAVYGNEPRHLDLPHYPWQREHHWHQAATCPWPPVGTRPGARDAPEEDAGHDARKEPAEGAAGAEPAEHAWLPATGTPAGPGTHHWTVPLDPERHGFLLDHRVAGQPLVPGAAFLELALATAGRLLPGSAPRVRGVVFREPMLLSDDGPWDQRLRVSAERDGTDWRLAVSGRSGNGAWTVHAEAALSRRDDGGADDTETPEEIRRRCPRWQAGEAFYRAQAHGGNTWRGAFRSVAELHTGDGEALARIRPAPPGAFVLHPAALDACLQTAVAALPGGAAADAGSRGAVLTAVDRLQVVRPGATGPLWCHARHVPAGSGDDDTGVRVDLTVYDQAGALVARATGVRARRLAPRPTAPADRPAAPVAGYVLRWREVPEPPGRGPGDDGSGVWVLLGDGTDRDARLAAALRARGRTAVVAPAGGDQEEAVARAVREAAGNDRVRAVVIPPPAGGPDPGATAREVQWTAADLCVRAVTVARAARSLAGLDRDGAPALFFVTRGAQTVRDADGCPSPWQAALWGLGPVVGREAGLRTTLIDLPADPEPGEPEALAGLLLSPGAEDRLALRGGRRHILRLLAAGPAAGPAPARPARPDGRPVTLALRTEEGIDRLALTPAPRPGPGPGQVEVQVSHVGLNYHDVLAAAGALTGEGHRFPDLGAECAGTVSRVGRGVTSVRPGDAVLALAYPAARAHVTVDQHLVVRRPGRLTMAEAAAVPGAYGTAYHALVELARLREGERVLIHSATGGVGMAALHLARARGAVVYATAGTESKRDLLLKLGAARVADSRDTRFAEAFRAAPDGGGGDGGGVDVVLNTLVGDAIEANFSLLRPFGRYIDLSKNAIDQGRPLSMGVFAQGRSYQAVDLLAMLSRPTWVGALLRDVIGLLDRGELPPPLCRIFPVEEAREAFSLMARSGHVGKVVLAFPTEEDRVPSGPDDGGVPLRPDRTYLVTGGLGGVGGLVAEWLVAGGARHLLLTGRSPLDTAGGNEAGGDERSRSLDRLRASGAEVEYAAVDVADEEAMAGLLRRRADAGVPPVAGVVHSAAVLDPAGTEELSERRIDGTLRPKVAGGWVLHRLFADQPLDFFVLFSSAVSLLGGLTVGHQLGAYAAGNAFLDALAEHRRAAGLPCTVVNWGYWARVGLAARLSERSGHEVRPTGVGAIEPENAPALFAAMLAADRRMIHMPADWRAYLAAYPADSGAPLLADLTGPAPAGATPAAAGPPGGGSRDERRVPGGPEGPGNPGRPEHGGPGDEPGGSGPAAQVPEDDVPGTAAPVAEMSPRELEEYLVAQVADVLGLPAGRLDRERPPQRLGLDSLMATQVRNRLRRDLGREVKVSQLLDAPDLRSLAAELAAAGPGTGAGERP
ncbi:beta-ketoacyl synthase N-terminal-like domain-containing protein [Streptomyces sp. URMC 129]|uniref:beta-ketoacyl synthase N-terminal-like domain-containing protein n=1 Tax=Streptomyces sp. URMC 129 TaxID=3423407 RepID=UPI003F1B18C8